MTNNSGSLPIEGGTLTGPLVLAGDPAAALQAATKQYVDAAAGGGVTGILPVLVADDTALTVTYNNGAGTLTNAGAQAAYSADGVTPAVGSRIIIAGQVSQFQNGIYTLTDAGSGVTNWVMTRATDYDVAAEMIPGVLISVLSGTLYGGSIWIQTNTITTVGTDALNFGNILNVYAYSNLSNLTTTFVNVSLEPDGDNLYDVGGGDAWRAVYAHTFKTSVNGLGLQSYILQGYDAATAAFIDWITITRANPGTCVLHGNITSTTQAPNDNSAKLATTAYADAAAAAGGATQALNNLVGVAINTSLVSDTDVTDNLGSTAIRWNNVYAQILRTGASDGQTLTICGLDSGPPNLQAFFTITNAAQATAVLSSEVTMSGSQTFGTSNQTIADTAFVQASRKNIVNAQTLAYTALAADQSKVIRYTGGGGVDLSLTAAATLGDGWFTTLRNDSSGTITINPAGAETINGTATLAVTTGNSVRIFCNGALFYTLGIAVTPYSPGSTDVPVADGGTGVSSLTAYAVMCGGTTSTNPVQSIASVGTSGQVLTSNGAGALPTFQSNPAGAGAIVFIASATAAASSVLNFAAAFSATYDNYLIVGEDVVPATDAAYLQAQFGTGAGPTYATANYNGRTWYGNSNFAPSTSAAGTAAMDIFGSTPGMDNVATTGGAFNITVCNVNNAANAKSLYGNNSCADSAARITCGGPSWQWQQPTVLTSIRFQMNSGNITTGIIKVYGIKNS